MNKKIHDIKEVAKYLDVSESQIRKLVRAKMIPFFRVGNRLKFDIVKIDSWIDSLEKKEEKNMLFYLVK